VDSDRLAKERRETDALEREALDLGIDIPKNADWWWDDSDEYSGPADMMEYVVQYYLTDKGKAGFRKLIRDEKRKNLEWQQKQTQWKLTIAGLIIGWVLGALGIVIGLVALFKNQ
jgi:hypothetical protein